MTLTVHFDEVDVADDHDETAARVLAVGDVVCRHLKALSGATVDDLAADRETVLEATAALERAFHTLSAIRTSPGYEAFLQRGPEALDADLQRRIQATLVPLGRLWGVEIDIDAPNETLVSGVRRFLRSVVSDE